MPHRDVMWFITRALHLLGREVPQAYREVQERAAGLQVSVRSDRGGGTIWVTSPGIETFGPADVSDVEARFTLSVITDLIDAKLSIGDALAQDRLVLAGSTEDLDRLVAGLQCFLRGAVRSRKIQALLDEFRTFAAI